MAWKTVSICRKTNEIVDCLKNDLGYTVINLRKVLVDEYGYKNANDINSKLGVTSSALYAPLVYHEPLGYSLIVKLVGELVNQEYSGRIRGKINCYCFYYCRNFDYYKYRVSLASFRAEYVYEEIIRLTLKQHKLLNYESPYYLP